MNDQSLYYYLNWQTGSHLKYRFGINSVIIKSSTIAEYSLEHSSNFSGHPYNGS